MERSSFVVVHTCCAQGSFTPTDGGVLDSRFFEVLGFWVRVVLSWLGLGLGLGLTLAHLRLHPRFRFRLN